MKKIIYFIATIAISLLLASCYDDKGNYDYTPISDIVVGGIDSTYRVIALVDPLRITPSVETGYSDDELEFLWLRRDPSNNTFDTLSFTKEMDDMITLPTGTHDCYYKIRHKENEYFSLTQFALEVTTLYSTGNYILKETADGNTDIDLLLNDDRLIKDMITNLHGQPIDGAPRSLGVLYNRKMVDPITLEKSYGHAIGIITYTGEANIYRTSDMVQVFDRTSLFYAENYDFIPYKFNTGYSSEFYTNRGVHTLSNYVGGGTNPAGSGLLTEPNVSMPGSDHFAYTAALSTSIFWDETNGRILSNEEEKLLTVLVDNLNDYECLFMGSNHLEKAWALLLHKQNNTMLLYCFETPFISYQAKIKAIWTVDPSSEAYSLLKNASHYATCEINYNQSYDYMYVVKDNKPYYISLTDNTLPVSEMTVAGLPTGETITYMSHRHYNYAKNEMFSYLVFATHSSGSYNIYMYNLYQGLPTGTPVRTASGEGKIKEIHYVGTVYNSNSVSTSCYGPPYGSPFARGDYWSSR